MQKTIVEYVIGVAMVLISLLILLVVGGVLWLIHMFVTSPVVQGWLGY